MSAPPEPQPLPSFAQLPVRQGAPPHSAWGVWGDDDQVGAINLLTPERIVAAARLVRRGAVFNLDLPLNLPDPPLFGRGAHRHTVLRFGGGNDDLLDNFYPQRSSQWDALCHVRAEEGWYNGFPSGEVVGRGGDKLGVEHWARRGIVGRCVLIDAAGSMAERGTPIPGDAPFPIGADLLDATLAAQGVVVQPGDVLLVRTGWVAHYLSLDRRARVALTTDLRCPGLDPALRTAEWLWDHHVAAVGTDCPGWEINPFDMEKGFLHQTVIGKLGLAIGEMWDFEALAADCAQDRVYEAMFVSKPIYLPGGVGSPPNAVAIK